MQKYNNFCSKSELDLARTPSIQTSIEHSVWDNIEPTSGWDKNSVIQFLVPGSSDKYVDLSQVQLFLQISITKNDDPIGNKAISVVNNLLHSLFKNIETKIGNTTIATNNDKYPYRSYIENLLSYNKEAKDNLLRGDFWFKDSINFDSLLLEDRQAVNEIKTGDAVTTKAVSFKASNPGFIKRNRLINDGQPFELCGNLHLDVASIDKFLLQGNNVTFNLSKAAKEFYFLGEEGTVSEYKINYLKTHLQIRRVSVAPSVMIAHESLIKLGPIPYPMKRASIVEVQTSFKSTECSILDVYTGPMPTRVIVGFVNTASFTGKCELNPFNFQNFGIKKLKLVLNSVSLPYANSLSFDYNKNCYFEAYSTLYKNIMEAPNDISYDEYKNGNTLYAFNLTPDLCSTNLSLTKNASLGIKCVFTNAQTESITAIFYLEFNNTFFITSNDGLLLDYVT